MKFPKLPPGYIRHFIRRSLDADSSIYYERRSHNIRVDFLSGSQEFIKNMMMHLEKAGLPERNIHKKDIP